MNEVPSTITLDRDVQAAKVAHTRAKLRLQEAHLRLTDAQIALQTDHDAGHHVAAHTDSIVRSIIEAEDEVTRASAEKMIASRGVGRALDKKRSSINDRFRIVGDVPEHVKDIIRGMVSETFGDDADVTTVITNVTSAGFPFGSSLFDMLFGGAGKTNIKPGMKHRTGGGSVFDGLRSESFGVRGG